MGFDRFPDGILEKAERILTILELTNWTWDVNKVLAQPELLTDAVFALKAIGEKIRTQKRNREMEEAMNA